MRGTPQTRPKQSAPQTHSIAGLFTLHISDGFVWPPRMYCVVLHVCIVKYRSPELVKRCHCFLFLSNNLPSSSLSHISFLSSDIHHLMKFIQQKPKYTYPGKKNVVTNLANSYIFNSLVLIIL